MTFASKFLAVALTAGIMSSPPPPAHADFIFNICPGAQAGVVEGTPTSCGFANNVAAIYWASGGATVLRDVYSPATGQFYTMTCFGSYLATFFGGGRRMTTRCVGGDDAEVVVW